MLFTILSINGALVKLTGAPSYFVTLHTMKKKMGAPRKSPSERRDNDVAVSLNAAEMAELDRLRSTIPKGTFLRHVFTEYAKSHPG